MQPQNQHTHMHVWTHARTHACTHARTHARTHEDLYAIADELEEEQQNTDIMLEDDHEAAEYTASFM